MCTYECISLTIVLFTDILTDEMTFYTFFNCLCKGKVVPVLNYEPRHKTCWGGGIAPRILDLVTRWR